MSTFEHSGNRFTGRAQNYARFRSRYPDAVIALLRTDAGWTEQSLIADIGAGTGLSSELFLRHGNWVWAVEPNSEMRAIAEGMRAQYPRLQVVEGTAELTTLANSCFDFAVAATALHWFDAKACHSEFLRILKPQGRVVLMSNEWQVGASPFMKAYADLLSSCRDGEGKGGGEPGGMGIANFFGAGGFRVEKFDNRQNLTLEELTGLVLSHSFSPLPEDSNYGPLIAALSELFTRFAVNGRVGFEVETVVYWGRLEAENSKQ